MGVELMDAHGVRIAVACDRMATYLLGFLRDDATMFDKFLYYTSTMGPRQKIELMN